MPSPREAPAVVSGDLTALLKKRPTLTPGPSPTRGRGRGSLDQALTQSDHPHPSPSPQGGGNRRALAIRTLQIELQQRRLVVRGLRFLLVDDAADFWREVLGDEHEVAAMGRAARLLVEAEGDRMRRVALRGTPGVDKSGCPAVERLRDAPR